MDVISLTKELIRFNTINPPGNEKKIALFIGTLLEKHGFVVEYPVYGHERLHMIASKGLSTKIPPIILTGHLDVVPLGAKKWSYDPFEPSIEHGKLYGRGSSDMKAGIAALTVAAVESTKDRSMEGGVKLVFTADEELGCRGAKSLMEKGYDLGKARAVIVGEPTSNHPYIAHKGGLYLEARTFGVTAHSSMPHLGENAIYKAARAITKIEKLDLEAEMDPSLGLPTINVGKIRGGLNLNSVPDQAEFTIDVRSTTTFGNDTALQKLNTLLGEEVKIEKLVDLRAVSTNENDAFIKSVFEICKLDPTQNDFKKAAPFLTDASVLTPWLNHPPTVILGPGEPQMAHQTDEFCYLNKIHDAVKIYSNILK
ncbi:M20 family metallopeptidase [Flagellimonas algicola]|uniref:Probable succinyl-diaminopimelate desuccinylase n=1 Tax=Flagellimonas algicola TaxID=2583815 RepID=A0ABY2WGY5_9FLAO|nr:M20 family metallopeptidase [Allomuricauda algicola]TMU50699.1 M20 family metallopeptidase [Allomuricauda algicola]